MFSSLLRQSGSTISQGLGHEADNLAISVYIILDPLTPSGKSTENRGGAAENHRLTYLEGVLRRAKVKATRWRAASHQRHAHRRDVQAVQHLENN